MLSKVKRTNRASKKRTTDKSDRYNLVRGRQTTSNSYQKKILDK